MDGTSTVVQRSPGRARAIGRVRIALPAGTEDVTAKLKKAKWPYAITGSIAAQARSPIAPVRQAMIYTAHVDTAVRFLDVRETDLGVNLLIVEPFDPSCSIAPTPSKASASWCRRKPPAIS